MGEEKKIKRSHTKSNLVYNDYFTFNKYHNIKDFAKCFFDLKRNDLVEFKDKFELFYNDPIKFKPNNEEQIKDLEKRKVVIPKGSELNDRFLSIYKAQHDKLTKTQKTRINVQNTPKNISVDLYLDEDEDDL